MLNILLVTERGDLNNVKINSLEFCNIEDKIRTSVFKFKNMTSFAIILHILCLFAKFHLILFPIHDVFSVRQCALKLTLNLRNFEFYFLNISLTCEELKICQQLINIRVLLSIFHKT